MNAGLSSLLALKRHLLPASLLPGNDYDDLILSLGLGVAAAFERACNRHFQRVASDISIFSADRDQYYLLRYPLEAVSKVEQKDSDLAGWITLTGVVQNTDVSSGLVDFGGVMGARFSLLRLTFTGGYWWDDTEDGSGVLPAGAAVLPADLAMAWHLQCRYLWSSMDILGTGLADPKKAVMPEIKLLPGVESALQPYRRFQIT